MAAIAVTGAVTARVAVDDPVIALRAERERLRTTNCNLPETREVEAFDLVDDLCQTEVQILEVEPQTLAGALAQVEQLCHWEDDGVVVGGDVAIRRLIKVLPERIERLAGRAGL